MSVFHQDVHFWRLIHLLKTFSTPVDRWAHFNEILTFCQNVTHCDGATLYLVEDHPKAGPRLNYAIIQNQSLGLNSVFPNPDEATLPPLSIVDSQKSTPPSLAAQCVNKGRVICVEDIYSSSDFNISGIKAFDQQFNYRTRSILSVPIPGKNNKALGVIQLINPQNPLSKTVAHYSDSQIQIIEALAALLATLIDQ